MKQGPVHHDSHRLPRSVLVTGGAGFIGCNFVRHLLHHDPDLRVVVLDALTYAGNLANLEEMPADCAGRFCFVHGDIGDLDLVVDLLSEHVVDTIVHLAAESHVDRSIDSPLEFVRTNVMGTASMLHAARIVWRDRSSTGSDSVRFHHVSTDEVFGSLGAEGFFDESTAYDPSSPYSATKAGSDHLVRSWGRTYGLPVTITNCSNNYGPYQFPEKLIPLMIMNGIEGKPLPVYGRGDNVRDWLHIQDHARAIDLVIRAGVPGRTYCVGGRCELTNLQLVRALCSELDRQRPDPEGPYERLITMVEDRPGHDQRYAIDCSSIEAELGWCPLESIESGLTKTVAWYLDHLEWMESVRSRGYDGGRLGRRV